MAFLYAVDRGLVGLCLDTVQELEPLRKMARGAANIEADAWPLLGSALRADLSDETIAELAMDLAPPDKSTIVAQLNALAGLVGTGTVREAARKLYRHGLDRNLTSLRADGGYLPPELLAPNILDEFRRADALALNSEGVAPSYISFGLVNNTSPSLPYTNRPPFFSSQKYFIRALFKSRAFFKYSGL